VAGNRGATKEKHPVFAVFSQNSKSKRLINRNRKKSLLAARKRLVTLVRALHTHNACNVASFSLCSLAARS
jgi:hypothetical protein